MASKAGNDLPAALLDALVADPAPNRQSRTHRACLVGTHTIICEFKIKLNEQCQVSRAEVRSDGHSHGMLGSILGS